ncbi:caspase family protein [Ferrovibrio terrae]|uniref:caspase family protein n=1 Tax=Ferrovibrio terrae TaxID=2594003 RepID=UPI003138107F
MGGLVQSRIGRFCIGMAAILAAAASLLAADPAQATSKRLALVIGNNAYADGVLKNPINDARMMAATLRELDFDVQVLENADRVSMQRAVVEFGRKLRDGSVGLFYFAGHGMQVRGSNYLIPVKASIESEEEVEVESMDVAYVMARMATAKNQFNIVILDACRNNPFQRSFRSVSNGLAAISAPTGTMIAYATAPGSVANDGDGANGIYTSELVAAIKRPGLSMEEAFKQARARVIQRTQGKQTPWESSSVVGEFSFKPSPPPQVAALSAPVPSPGFNDNAAEIAFWNSIKDSQDARDFQAYIENYPNGAFNKLARIRISNLPDPGSRVRAASAPAPVTGPVATAPAAAVVIAAPPQPASSSPAPSPAASPPSAPPPSAPPTAVASLKAAPQSSTPAVSAPIVNTEDFEATLQKNWPAIQAAIKKHMDDQFEVYRNIIPANDSITGLRFYKAVLQDIVDAGSGKVNVLVEGARFGRHAFGSIPLWSNYTAVFGYVLKIVDDKVIIEDYRYISKT